MNQQVFKKNLPGLCVDPTVWLLLPTYVIQWVTSGFAPLLKQGDMTLKMDKGNNCGSTNLQNQAHKRDQEVSPGTSLLSSHKMISKAGKQNDISGPFRRPISN